MKTMKDLLKQTEQLAGSTKIKLQLHAPLKKVRAYPERIAALGIGKITIVGGSKPAATKAKPKTSAKKAVKNVVTRQKPAVKRQSKAVAQNPLKAKVSAKRAATGTVTQVAVLAALRSKHNTPAAIANAMEANRVQVTKALSRYTQQGLIVRTQPGHYALKK